MSKYRLIQMFTYHLNEYKEEYRIQKNYGSILFPEWMTLIDETHKTKELATQRLEEIRQDKTIKSKYKTIKVIK